MKKCVVAILVFSCAIVNLNLGKNSISQKNGLSITFLMNANADSGESCAVTENFYFNGNDGWQSYFDGFCVDENFRICGFASTCGVDPNGAAFCTSTVCT